MLTCRYMQTVAITIKKLSYIQHTELHVTSSTFSSNDIVHNCDVQNNRVYMFP